MSFWRPGAGTDESRLPTFFCAAADVFGMRKMLTKREIARKIDHAVLKPSATDKDVVEGCRMCARRGVGCICVRPTDVALAAKELADSGCRVSAVVGFPHGSNQPEVKALEAKLALEDGAVELDMVMNIGKFLSGDYNFVQKDIEAVVAQAKKHEAVVKVILEICCLSPEQIAEACRLAERAGADFVKTSTGFGDGSATPQAVDIMTRAVGKTMGVKAAGGIRAYETAVGYLKQGCERLGTSSTEAILDAAPE